MIWQDVHLDENRVCVPGNVLISQLTAPVGLVNILRISQRAWGDVPSATRRTSSCIAALRRRPAATLQGFAVGIWGLVICLRNTADG